jgi:hypothetical protein
MQSRSMKRIIWAGLRYSMLLSRGTLKFVVNWSGKEPVVALVILKTLLLPIMRAGIA